MNRTERLYALVEELRAVAPRRRSATWLADRFEVSVRTIERDLDALRASGVPIWADAGRTGGYAIDRERTLPPLTLTPTEALAITVALRSIDGSPFTVAARRAGQKVLATLPGDVRRREQALAERIHRVRRTDEADGTAAVVGDAVEHGWVLHLAYRDRHGAQSERDVEPLGLLWADEGWCLIAWCRLRQGIRGFMLDRIDAIGRLDERVPARPAAVLQAELARFDTENLLTH